MTFTNRDLMRRRMTAIPVAVRKAVRAQIATNARELAELQKRFAETSRDSGKLISSIKAQNVSDSTRIAWRISAGGPYAVYARWVEFGTAASAAEAPRQNRNFRRTVVTTKGRAAHHGTEAQPFFWPAYRLKKRAFKARVSRAAKKAMKDAIR